ncbi:MAG: helicase-related protein, partial [Rhodanobacter sp.]
PARERRQVLLFSATLSYRVLELAYEHMHNPEKLVAESDHVTADHVHQSVYFPAREEKMPLLLNLLDRLKPTRSIIFVNTKAAAEHITERVRRHGCRVGAVSGDVPQLKRQKLLQRFKAGQLDILVATDVAARGLHIPEVSHVFNFDLPHEAEDYVHRIGRTARLGAEGDAISFACDRYAIALPDIEAYIGQSIPVGHMDPELLIMPKPRALDPEYAANVAADSAAFGDVVPPRPGEAPRRGRTGAHAGERHGAAAAGSARRSPRPRPSASSGAVGDGVAQAAADIAPTQVAEVAAGAAVADIATKPESVRKPRRHRGGRGRTHRTDDAGAVEADSAKTANASSVPANRASRGPRRPQRERQEASPTAGIRRPSHQVAVTAGAPGAHAHPKKPGLFRRLTRLFTGR